MDMNETKNTLPLPVKEIVRHMRKSFSSSSARGRRLSDIYPLPFRNHQDVSQKARCAITPNVPSSTPTFFPLSCSSTSSSTFNKLTSTKNMDVIVPSVSHGVHIAANTPVSFHEQERSGVRFCANTQFSNTSLDSVSDTCGLDDRIEERSLMTFIRPNLISTTHQTTAYCMPAQFSVAAKLEYDDSLATVRKCLSSNSTLTELHMERDISSLNHVMVSSDSQCNYSKHGLTGHDVNDFSNHTSSVPGCVPVSSQAMKHVDTVSSSSNLGVLQKNPADTSIIQNTASLRTNFPPRASHPQIGVAAVIKPKLESTVFSKMENDGLENIKFQSPDLYRILIMKSPQSELKSDDLSSTKAYHDRKNVALQITASSNQILTPSSITKWTNASILQTGIVSSESLILEESTDEKWKDVKNFMHSPEYEPSIKRRKRIDVADSTVNDVTNCPLSRGYRRAWSLNKHNIHNS